MSEVALLNAGRRMTALSQVPGSHADGLRPKVQVADRGCDADKLFEALPENHDEGVLSRLCLRGPAVRLVGLLVEPHCAAFYQRGIP